MTNSQIAEALDECADLLEFLGANAFRVRAYRNGARAIRDLAESVETILQDSQRKLTDIDGIGKSVSEKCHVLVETGELPQLVELRAKVPHTVLDMMRVPGLGPKKAAVLFKELRIQSLDQLKAACEAEEVQKLKGFGKKTEEAILKGISIAEAANQRIYWSEADEIAQQLVAHLKQVEGIQKLELAGSYRRRRDTVGDLDVLVVAAHPSQVMDHFAAFPGVDDVLARGDTKMSVRIHTGLQIDLRIVPRESFGAALQYFTGSKEHNVVMRGIARQRGLKVNEYGVYRVDGERETYVAGETEEGVYAALEMPWFPPELRESRGEFEWAARGELPELVELRDLRGDLHMHTTETDGKASLEEMAEAAIALGHKYIAITDHSRRVTMARGLDPVRLRKQWKAIETLNEQLEGRLVVLKGIECDILEKGGMDLPEDVLAEADWVLASVHYGQQQPRQQITQRILEALENPHVSAIAHPTGRLINRRDPYEVDMDAVFAAASQHGKMLELNANPMRLDLNDVHCAAAKRHGIPVVISSDAHSTGGLACLRYGVLQARRGGLTKSDIANCWPWSKIKQRLAKP